VYLAWRELMNSYELILTLVSFIAHLVGGICCLIAAWLIHGMMRRERRVKREIRKMWTTAKVLGNLLHQGAVREMAAILDIELDEE
jgi:hypothetical protein